MEKVICFGIGLRYNILIELILSKFEVVGLIDNDKNKQGQMINSLEVKSPEFLRGGDGGLVYDKILILPIQNMFKIFNQLINLGIPFEKIDFYFYNGFIPQKQIINGNLVLNGKKTRLMIEHDHDIYLLEEGLNHILGLNDNSHYVLVNIGGNVADTALSYATFENITKVYAYEPFKKTYNRGLENLKLNPNLSNKIEYNNFAISNKNGELFLDEYDDMGANIIFANKGSNKVVVRDVAEIFNEILAKHSEEIFLEIDCEGSEYEILEKLEAENMLNKVSVIAMEYHIHNRDYEKTIIFLENILKRNGFMFSMAPHIHCGTIYAFNTNVLKR